MKKILILCFAFLGLVSLISCDDVPKPPVDYEFTTPQTDALKLDQSYEGKDFIKDGIGKVTVANYIDGDTANFITSSGTKFTVRFSGVNTPESTYTVNPWGFAASKYTKDTLSKAKEIVLVAEDLENRFDSTMKRYLAWVWVDGRLLNLELAEVALGVAKASGTVYAEQFAAVVLPLAKAKVRIYGQVDPDYDYSLEGKTLSIKNIRETYGTSESILEEKGKGTKVVITGTIVRNNGTNSAYLQQYDSDTDKYYGIYLYGGFSANTKLSVGNTVIVKGTIGYYGGALQISSVTSASTTVKSFGNGNYFFYEEIQSPSEITIQDYDKQGLLVKITSPLYIEDFYDTAANDGFTLRATYQFNGETKRIDIRVDQNIALKDENGEKIRSGEYFKGKTFKTLIAIVGYYDSDLDDNAYDGHVQLLLTRMTDIEYFD